MRKFIWAFFVVFGLCHVYSVFALKFESFDGTQGMFQIMNGHPFRFYINERRLQFLTQAPAYLIPFLQSSLSFGKIYLLMGLWITLLPLALLGTLVAYLIHQKREEIVTFVLLVYVLAIMPSYSFGLGLIPETVLLCLASVIGFFCPPKSFLGKFIFIVASFWYPLGYETIFAVPVVLTGICFVEFFRGKSEFLVFRLLLLLSSFAPILWRLRYIQTRGFFFSSLEYVLTETGYFSVTLYLLMVVFFVLVLLVLLKPEVLEKKSVRRFFALFLIVGLIVFITFYRLNPYHLLWFRAFHLRVLTVPFALLIMVPALLPALFSALSERFQKTKDYFLVLLGCASIVLLLHDFRTTNEWIEIRKDRVSALRTFPDGCSLSDRVGWDMKYMSVLLEQSFTPKKLVFARKSEVQPEIAGDQQCELVNDNGVLVPYGLKNHDIRLITFPVSGDPDRR